MNKRIISTNGQSIRPSSDLVYELNPLAGKRIVITRSRDRAQGMRQTLVAAGAQPLLFPTIQFAPLAGSDLDDAVARLHEYSWLLFASATAVRFFLRRWLELGAPPTPPIGVIGSATAEELDRFGLHAAFMPERFIGDELAAGLGDLNDQRILLPRSRIGRLETVEALQRQGATVDELAIYDTVVAEPSLPVLAEIRLGVDVVTFTSPSTVRNFLQILEQIDVDGRALLTNCLVACIGPVTAEAAKEFDLDVGAVAEEHSESGLLIALERYFLETDHAG